MVSQNNDGNYYEIAVDTAKEGAEVWSLNDWFKARVGDEGTPLVMRFYTQGQLNSFDGHQKPIIEGNVGAYSFDKNKQIVMAADAKVVSWTGDPSDMLPGGRVRYHFPKQMFPTEGAFYGFVGYVDESTGRRLTGVNVWFRVLGGVAQMGRACDYYINDLDIALANAKEKMRQAGIDFKAATDSALQDLRTKYQQEVQANQDASETTRAGLSKLADSVGAIQAQIDAGNVVTLKAFNDSSAELSTRQNNLEYAINEKLSQMRTAPRGIASLSSLQSKYPSGDDNLYVTVDTGHWYYWDGSAWSDGGVYQTQATDQTVIDKATDANNLAAGMSLISNGSFSNGKIDPAFSSGKATLSVTEYAGQKWLKVVADGSNASQGFAYTLKNIDGRLKSPIHINFTYQSSITQELSLYLIGYDASGKQLFYNEIEKYNAVNWFFEKVDVYKKIVLPSDVSFEQLDHVTLAFSSTHATSFVMLIAQVKVNMEASVHHKFGKNLIQDSIKFDSTSGIDALTKETNLQVANYLGRKWLKITSSSIDKNQGAGWRIPTYNGEIFANPLHIKFDMQSSVNQTLALDVHYFDNADRDLGYQNVASIDCKSYSFKEIDEFVKLIAPPSGEVSYVKLMLFNPSSSSIGTLLIEPLSVTFDVPSESYKAAGMSLISNGSFSNGKIDPAFSSGKATLSVTEYAGQKWLKVVADGSNASQGFAYTLKNIDGRLKSPIHINFTYQSSITQELSLYLIGYDASGKQLFYNEIEKYNAVNWFFEKVDVYKKIVLPSDVSFEQLDHVTLAFSSTHATSFVMLIAQVKVNMEASVHHKFGKNLIQDSIKFDSTSGIDALTKETNLQVANYLGRKWLKITSSSIDKNQGAGWRIPTYNGEIFANPLHIKFDMQSSVNQTLALDVHYFDNADRDLGYQNVASIDCKSYSFKEIDEFVKLIAPPSGEVSYVKLMLFNPSSSSIGTLLIEPPSVTLDFPAESYKGVLIPNGDFYNGDTRPASANTSDTQLQVVNVMGKKWLKITSSGTTRYRGVYWTIEDDKTASAFSNPIHLCMTVQSSIKQTLGISIHLFKADGTDLGSINYSDDLNLNPYQTVKYSHDILLTPKNGINPEDVDHFTILLSTSGTEDLGTILVTDVKANIKIFDSPSNDDVSYSSLPTVYLDGDTSSMSGDTYVTMKFRYINRKQVVSGYASTKWQGDSSLRWPKKAYRIKTYYDKDLNQKMNFRPLSTWDKNNKFNLKAYYNDPTLAKDVVNAQIGAAIWSTESHIPTQMERTNAYGFIVGFPVQVYVNNIFYGVFSFNTTKGDYPYAKYVVAGKVYSNATTFRSLPDGGVKLDGSDFEMVSPDDPDDTIKKLMNDAISFVSTSNDDDFKNKFENYFDKESVIDYLIFNNIVDNGDAWAKNQTFVTWDGQKLYMHPYDMDASLGGDYDGSLVGPANAIRGVGNAGMSYHGLFKRVNKLFNDDVRARYKNLRTWLTPDYTTTKFKNYMEKIGEGNYLREFAKWDNPNHDQNTFNYIKYNLIQSMKICDKNWLN